MEIEREELVGDAGNLHGIKGKTHCMQPIHGLNIVARDLHSSEHNASEHLILLAIFERPIAGQCWQGRDGIILKILEKKHNFPTGIGVPMHG